MDDRLPDPRMIPKWAAAPAEPDPGPGRRRGTEAPEPAGQQADDVDDPLVRPFIVTGGRTTPLSDDLRLETLVSALPALLTAPLAFESRRIAELCQRPTSLAEISASLAVPTGVAKVLVADLVAARAVICHEPARTSRATIERIRDLVKAL
ncbi:DUF742 domain-containing protein [Actinospica durhamensis]|uniref:DUF742 domain-containing protein n=1 Tax=Actinospica durhamensis TaxID=1508375 RepID=A0A941IT26_9ACTN|nr:DUF742 domain-containing protein [Actinospica durhamensis]MBR7833891.1 DUF742 domain-containing protein [Actinospica durhamensis]